MPAALTAPVQRRRLFWGVKPVKKFALVCGAAAAALSLSACATVTRGTSQKYTIDSSPTQAEVTLSTGQQCVTPCKMKLKRKPGFTATVKKPGYQSQTVTVESKLGGGGVVAGAGNVILGGVIGGIVDGTNGSMNNLTPNPLMVTLVPEATAPVAAVETAPVVATNPAPADPAAVDTAASADAAAPAQSTEAAPAAPAPGGE